MFHASRLNQSRLREGRFLLLSAQLILRTVCELISYDTQIIFIHCQGINFVSKAKDDYLK